MRYFLSFVLLLRLGEFLIPLMDRTQQPGLFCFQFAVLLFGACQPHCTGATQGTSSRKPGQERDEIPDYAKQNDPPLVYDEYRDNAHGKHEPAVRVKQEPEGARLLHELLL